jgi:fructose-bisphosphate aldolase/6-deoxy-5-ketofructose 1-phosphate synthase
LRQQRQPKEGTGAQQLPQRKENNMTLMPHDVLVPLDVPGVLKDQYINNYLEATARSGRLMLFAGDQKIEHLNDDFYGEGIHEDDADPEHLFRIAQGSRIGVFAAQLGLIARYGMDYRDVRYLVKVNSKTHLVKAKQKDPLSTQLIEVSQISEFQKNSGLTIVGVGYTIYLGSEFEYEMIEEAAQLVYEAHRHGLITVLWMYPRGQAVENERDPHLIAGAAGVAACLGSDFVKVNYPSKQGKDPAILLREATKAAGRTKVVCAGGATTDVKKFLQTLHDQINVGGASGNATGRNVHQKSLDEAISMCNAVYALTVEGATAEEAFAIYRGR